MFKIRNGLSPSQCAQNRQTINEIHGYQIRSVASNDYYLHKFSQCYGQKAFTYIGARTWINLPVQVKNAHSLFTFKIRFTYRILRVLVPTSSIRGGGRNRLPSISRTTNATKLKPWEDLGVSFEVSKNFMLI